MDFDPKHGIVRLLARHPDPNHAAPKVGIGRQFTREICVQESQKRIRIQSSALNICPLEIGIRENLINVDLKSRIGGLLTCMRMRRNGRER